VPSFAIEAVTWMPSITICPPPMLTRPRLDSPLVTKVLPSRVARVDDRNSVSPSPGVDADASDRGAPVAPTVGKLVDGTVTDGAGLVPAVLSLGVVTVATGVGTVALGVVTFTFGAGAFGSGAFGIATVAIGVVTVGFFGATPCHFAFHPASACRSWPSNPLGTARVGAPPGSPGPLNPFDASEASAVARYSSAAAVAYGPPWLP
jgi:hypothetical protein